MSRNLLIKFLLLIVMASSIAALDPSPLQDICAATNDTKYSVRVNGEFCKDPAHTTSDDFYYTGFNIRANTSNILGKASTRLSPENLPGLNTAGVTMSRLDFAPGGVNPPHHHPRATEMILVMKGTIRAGFVTSNPEHRLFSKVLKPGDVFVIPFGLVHFQHNIGKTDALAFTAFSSQNPGTNNEASAVFNADPPIETEVIARSFQLKPGSKSLKGNLGSTHKFDILINLPIYMYGSNIKLGGVTRYVFKLISDDSFTCVCHQ